MGMWLSCREGTDVVQRERDPGHRSVALGGLRLKVWATSSLT